MNVLSEQKEKKTHNTMSSNFGINPFDGDEAKVQLQFSQRAAKTGTSTIGTSVAYFKWVPE